MTASRRRAGLLIPLFSCPSTTQLGHRRDRRHRAASTQWLAAAGQRVLQLLPINEMAPRPAVALLGHQRDGDRSDLHPPARTCRNLPRSAAKRRSTRDDRASARRRARRRRASTTRRCGASSEPRCARAFDRFLDANGAQRHRARRGASRRFCAEQAWWLDDYALFRALHARRRRACLDRMARAAARSRARRRSPTRAASSRARSCSTSTCSGSPTRSGGARAAHARRGALRRSAVHGRRRQRRRLGASGQFRLDVSVGVPPDAFSATGQDWGMPVYRWDEIAAGRLRAGCASARGGAPRSSTATASITSSGFYRTYARPHGGGEPFFTPADEAEQVALGEHVLEHLPRAGRRDHRRGSRPRFPTSCARRSARLGVPGFRVFRWERHWHDAGQPFRDPAEYPAMSVATSGTHDTEPMAAWWDSAVEDEQIARPRCDAMSALTQGPMFGSAIVRDGSLEIAVRVGF